MKDYREQEDYTQREEFSVFLNICTVGVCQPNRITCTAVIQSIHGFKKNTEIKNENDDVSYRYKLLS